MNCRNKDTDSGRVYEEKTLVHELTQGLQMAQRLKVNLHSPQTRDFLIQKILSSYENALFVLRSADSALQSTSLPESLISFGSPRSEEFEFGQPFRARKGENVISKKRKRCTTWEDNIVYNGAHTCNHGAQSVSLPPSSSSPPSSTEKQLKKQLSNHHLSPASHDGEMLSNLRGNLSVDTSDLRDTIPSSFSFPSTTSSGLIMEDCQQLDFPSYYDDELLQVYSPPFFISKSNIFTEWESSQSLDFLADTGFEFKNSFF